MSQQNSNNDEESREGYTPQQEENTNYNRQSLPRKEGERAPRQRFTRNAHFVDSGEREYRSRYYERNERDNYQRPSWQERPNGENNRYGEYQDRGNSYRPNRPRFTQNRNGYQPRNWQENRPYRPRYAQDEQGYERNDYQQYRGEGQNYQRRSNNHQGYNRPYYQDQKDFQPRFQPHRSANNRSLKPKYSLKKRLEYKEENYDPTVPIRLNKFLANAGVCSRRDADKYIEAGVISVNGTVVTELGTKVLRTDEVKFHGNLVRMEKKVYVLLNKPKGYVTTSEDPQNRKTVMELVQNACPERIYPVGRLDRYTTGVLLFTNDGELASKLTHPQFLKKKIYHVTTDQNVTAADMRRIAEGIMLEDGEIKADAIEYANATDKKQIGIEIHSGKNRIVRRIFDSLGYHVVKLDRVYFAGLTKKNLRRGDWRYLTQREVEMLRRGAFE